MKKSISIFLLVLFFSCQRQESFSTYKISAVKNTGAFDCLYFATSEGLPAIEFYAKCGKYKYGQTLKVQMP